MANYYISTIGNDSNSGTRDYPMATLTETWKKVSSGDTIYVSGGTYTFSPQTISNKSGTSSYYINIQNCENEIPIFDYSGQVFGTEKRGLTVNNVNYVNISGIKIRNLLQSGDFIHYGIVVESSSYVNITNVEVSYIGGDGYSTINSNNIHYINCDAHHLADPLSSSDPNGGSNGFAVTGVGNTSTNIFYNGCRAWYCSDEGWDFIYCNGYRELDNCWAFLNGKLFDTVSNYPGTNVNGDGFKFGVNTSGQLSTTTLVKATRCLAWNNKMHGFDQNMTSSNYFRIELYNCTSIGHNIISGETTFTCGYYMGSGSVGASHIMKNCISYDNSWISVYNNNVIHNNNTFDSDVLVSYDDFIDSSNYQYLYSNRKNDGSLPDIDFLHLKPNSYGSNKSDLINIGVNVGLPYSGPAPDLGAFETSTTYYLSPSGNDQTNNGLSVESPWFSLNKAWGYVVSGDTILMSGGTYVYNTQQQLFNKSGSSGNTIKIWSMENQFPKITRQTGSSIQYGIYMYNSNYIHIKGLEIYGYLQPGTAGSYSSILGYDVNNCVFENLKLHDSVYGLALGNVSAGSIGSAGNLILNVDSYNCYDPYSTNGQGAYENANAFSFNGQINNNSNGPNVFRNCRAFLCCDDGWDMYGSNADYIYENCWAFWNGYLLSGGTVVYDDNGYIVSGGTIVLAAGIGNGEGFKMGPLEYGGTYTQDRSTEIQSKLYNCVSFYNSDHGFAQNYAKARILLYNCTSFGNGSAGYNLSDWSGQPYAPANGLNLQINHILINCLSYNNNIRIGNFNSYSTIDHNSFGYQSYDPPYDMYGTGTVRLNVTDNDFVTLNPTGDTINVLSSRNQDGTLPNINFLNLTASSILRNAGTPVGLPYQDNYPDIGAFEYYVAFKVVKILNKVLTRNGKVIIK